MKKSVIIENWQGLHARPAAKIIEMINECKEKVTLKKNDESKVEIQGIMSILTLAAAYGDKIEIECNNDRIVKDIEYILTSQEFNQFKIKVIRKKPKNIYKFIQKFCKKAKKPIFFTTKTFTEAIQNAYDRGDFIDRKKIYKAKDLWCIGGKDNFLIFALGVNKKNNLQIISEQ